MIKINQLEIENVKRVRAVKIEPSPNGLTIIGGRNGQGKTSVLDAIAWALGGDRYRPSSPQRDGSVIPPTLHVELSNGLVVERRGKNSDLKVYDPQGGRAGQALLSALISQLALDLPKFLQASPREKADVLLKIIGVGSQLQELTRKETELYNSRRAIGQIADQKAKYAREQPYYPEAPHDLISPSELIAQQQDILARNGENQRKRQLAAELEARRITLLQKLEELREQYEEACQDCIIANRSASVLQDESTAELEENLANIEDINRKVRANLDKAKAEEDAESYQMQYEALSLEIDQVRSAKAALLEEAALPLPGLFVEDGELTYQGRRWDCMSGAEQLKVATAIVRKINPECGFVLLDKLEQMDPETLSEFGAWLEGEGLQAIATRVSTGGECSIIIEDGYAIEPQTTQPAAHWRKGEF